MTWKPTGIFLKLLSSTSAINSLKKKTVNEIKQPPWLMRDLLRLIRQKTAAWKAFKISKLQVDEQNFRALQKKVKKLTKNAKHKHEVQISRDAKTNPMLFYSYLS